MGKSYVYTVCHIKPYNIDQCSDCPKVAHCEGYYLCTLAGALLTDKTFGSPYQLPPLQVPEWCPLPRYEKVVCVTCPRCGGGKLSYHPNTGQAYSCAACLGNGEITMEVLTAFLNGSFERSGPGPDQEREIKTSGLGVKGYYSNNIQSLREGFRSRYPNKTHAEILTILHQLQEEEE